VTERAFVALSPLPEGTNVARRIDDDGAAVAEVEDERRIAETGLVNCGDLDHSFRFL
jgi:hypothetical protein